MRYVAQGVLILSWEYPPVVEGGLARHVGKLAERLAARGLHVDVLTRSVGDVCTPQAVTSEVREGVRVHRVGAPPWPRQVERFISWVQNMNEDIAELGRRLGGDRRYHLVHGHDWLVANACAELSSHLRVPVVSTIHATEHGRHKGWVQKPPQSQIHSIETSMAQRADRLIVCSEYMRRHVCAALGVEGSKISVIPNGIDLSDRRASGDLVALRERFARPQERLVLLVGRLVYEKGFQVALDALAQLTHEIAGVRFLLAGSGTHEQELRAQARRLQLERHGVFLGWLDDHALHSLYEIADLCVVPSLYEPFGLVALEAMASGCPCIVADTGGLREVVPGDGRVGLRFSGGDAQHLAAAMRRLLGDEQLRQRLIAEARAHVRAFDWGQVVEATHQVYQDAIGAHMRSTGRICSTAASHVHRGGGLRHARRADARFPADAAASAAADARRSR